MEFKSAKQVYAKAVEFLETINWDVDKQRKELMKHIDEAAKTGQMYITIPLVELYRFTYYRKLLMELRRKGYVIEYKSDKVEIIWCPPDIELDSAEQSLQASRIANMERIMGFIQKATAKGEKEIQITKLWYHDILEIIAKLEAVGYTIERQKDDRYIKIVWR